ncbi:MAG: DUF4340 domain-containing protein [Acidobacteria bacterium]|nr:DUF4340 domain-containing protein [Acidobacteriota bacterium]
MRGFRSTLILLVVFLGLLGYIYFYESKRPAGDTPEAKPKVFTVEADKITELSVKAESGERSELRKSDGRWMLVKPEQQAVDESEVSSITSNLTNLEIQRVVEESPGDLKQYGLAEPRIEVGYRADGTEKRLLIGGKTATGGDLYAKLPDENKIFLIAGYLDGSFNKTPFNLRDKAVLKFERDKVDAVEIASAAPNGTQMRFEKKPGEDWTMVRPVDARADVPAVEGVIGRLQSAQMKSIVAPDATKPAEYGLDKPAVTITVGAASARHQLTIGKEAPDSAVYARESARPLVFTVDKSLVDDIKKPVDDFRDKDLFKFRSFNAERLELTRGRDTWVFEKSKDSGGQERWRQVSPSAKDVDSSKMDTLLMKVSNLRAKSFPVSDAAKIKTSLETPVLSVAAKYDGKDERVVFGRAGDNVYASRRGDAGAAQIETTDFDDVLKALDDLNAPAPAPEPMKKP